LSLISEDVAREHIMEIQRSYMYVEDRALKSLKAAMDIIQKNFTREGHFILEFIQNAEDAEASKIKIVLEKNALKIFNNGRPFTRDDVEAICSIGRSHKDPRTYIGYLGVGFKSVFLISSNIHIYSKPYRFKFDRNYWNNPDNVPWQITPIWLDEIPKEFIEWNTGFYISIDAEGYQIIKNELKSLTPSLLLFLRNIKEIEIEYENGKKEFRINKIEEFTNKFFKYELEVIENGSRKEISHWIIFRRTIEVPRDIREDKTTKEWGRNVVEFREIAIAFKLDDSGDLTPVKGAAKLGVFSYVPLKEEAIGLPYYIHADFLLTQNRESIQRDARWNIWILDEIAKFITDSVIEVFKSHEKWKYSFINILYTDVNREPFSARLINPIKNKIENGNYFITFDGNFTKFSEIIKVEKDVLNQINFSCIEKITGKKVLHPDVKLPRLLIDRLKKGDIINEMKDLRKYLRNKELRHIIKDLEGKCDKILELLEPFDLLERLKNLKTSDEEKIEIVKRLKEFWKRGLIKGQDLINKGFVIKTKSGKWIEPQRVFLSSEYKPSKDIERLVEEGLLKNQQLEFVDPIFIKDASNDEIEEWKRFLNDLKINSKIENDKSIVEAVGIEVALKYLTEVRAIPKKNIIINESKEGYDIEVRRSDGSSEYIEVKGSKSCSEISLTRKEFETLQNKENSFLYVVINALSDPMLIIIEKDRLSNILPSKIMISCNDLYSNKSKVWKPLIDVTLEKYSKT